MSACYLPAAAIPLLRKVMILLYVQGMTNTHNKSLSPNAFNTLKEVWKAFMINEIKIWREFYSYWLSDAHIISTTEVSAIAHTKQSEILVIRYEDLLLHKEVK